VALFKISYQITRIGILEMEANDISEAKLKANEDLMNASAIPEQGDSKDGEFQGERVKSFFITRITLMPKE